MVSKIDTLLDKIETKQREISGIEFEIDNVLLPQLNDECKKVIFEKYKKGSYVTHKDRWVFKLEDVQKCMVITNSFITLNDKKILIARTENGINVCRAISFIDNARPSTKNEIRVYNDLHKKEKRDSK